MSHFPSAICLRTLLRPLLISRTPSSGRMKSKLRSLKWRVLVTPAVKSPKDGLVTARHLDCRLRGCQWCEPFRVFVCANRERVHKVESIPPDRLGNYASNLMAD